MDQFIKIDAIGPNLLTITRNGDRTSLPITSFPVTLVTRGLEIKDCQSSTPLTVEANMLPTTMTPDGPECKVEIHDSSSQLLLCQQFDNPRLTNLYEAPESE